MKSVNLILVLYDKPDLRKSVNNDLSFVQSKGFICLEIKDHFIMY
jgi:hypothetical protein